MKTLSHFLLCALAFTFCTTASAQLPDGSTAPDFTITDTDGVEHNLYTYLNEGKHVLVCFDATWNGPSWAYLNSNAMNDVHEIYGPEGTDEFVVLMIEADAATDMNDLLGTGENTQGDFLSVANFPVADDGEDIYDDFDCGYYPTIFSICPDGITQEIYQYTAEVIYQMQDEFCCDGQIPNDLRLFPIESSSVISCTGDAIQVVLHNNGANEATDCTFEIHQSGELIHTHEWNGSLLSCEGEIVFIEDIDFNDGVIDVSIADIDEIPSNNTISMTVEQTYSTGTSHIRVSLLTDTYVAETSWTVMDEQGTVVAVSGPNLQAQTLYLTDLYLPSLGCYIFTLTDSYGDGLNAEQWGGVAGDIQLTYFDEDGMESESLINYNAQDFLILQRTIFNEQEVPITASGFVFFDENENGIMDENEDGIQGIAVELDNQSTITSTQGFYSFSDFDEALSLTVENDLESWPTNTTSNSIDLTNTSNYYNHFGLSSNDPIYRGNINYAQSGVFICEQPASLFLSITNSGNSSIDAELMFDLDPFFTFQDANPVLEEQDGQNLTWLIEDIPAGNTVYLTIYVTAPDWQSMGELLTNTVILNVYDQEGNLQDSDTQIEEDVLFCSYDPNDKQVFPAGITENHYVPSGTRFEYFIRFQNTGNYFATDVTVTDPISELLDLESFELVSTSHYCIPSIDFENRVIDFHFPDIMLPDSTANEPDSHGSITFLIDHVANVVQPAPIENTAYIYFDSNPAVVTNTTLSTIDDLNTIFELSSSVKMEVYPNPASSELTIRTPEAQDFSTLVVKDALGRSVIDQTNHQVQSTLAISELPDGMYILEWRSKDNQLLASSRFVKQ